MLDPNEVVKLIAAAIGVIGTGLRYWGHARAKRATKTTQEIGPEEIGDVDILRQSIEDLTIRFDKMESSRKAARDAYGYDFAALMAIIRNVASLSVGTTEEALNQQDTIYRIIRSYPDFPSREVLIAEVQLLFGHFVGQEGQPHETVWHQDRQESDRRRNPRISRTAHADQRSDTGRVSASDNTTAGIERYQTSSTDHSTTGPKPRTQQVGHPRPGQDGSVDHR